MASFAQQHSPETLHPCPGPRLSESLLGFRRQLAQQWAERYHFPLAPDHQPDLAHVAQYLAVDQALLFPRNELINHWRKEVLDWHRGDLVEMRETFGINLDNPSRGPSLEQLIRAVGRKQRERNPVEPHRVLTQLPLPIYITTDPTNLLADALAKFKTPRVEICRWKDTLRIPSIFGWCPSTLVMRFN